MTQETPDLILFFGRFHPLVVHLPIGFLILAVVMEFCSRLPRLEALRPAISFAWLLGGLSAVVAVVLGYLLSLGGGYNPDTLFWHQWGGIAVAVLSLVCYFAGKKGSKWNQFVNARTQLVLTLGGGVMLTITGHLGGNLTHGSTYLLEYAPNPVRTLAGLPVKESRGTRQITSLDSADIFADAILPIMEAKCVSCHNSDKIKGELLLTSYEAMLEGGESGPAIVPASVGGSELYRRINLPQDHDDFKPTDGKTPLTDEQVTIIHWWIKEGAVRQGMITSFDPDEEMIALFTEFFGMNEDGLSSVDVPRADPQAIDSLFAQGFQLYRLAEGSNVLEADLPIRGVQANDVNLASLLAIKEQLVWLQLPNCQVEDEHLEVIGQLSQLRKLNLNRNKITDEGIKSLVGLEHLEYLNLYGNEISDASLPAIRQLPSLQRLYLRDTKVTPSAIEQLIEDRPDLQVFYVMPELL